MFIHKTATFLMVIFVACLLAACGQSQQSGSGTPATTDKSAGEMFKWRMVTTWPPNFPILQEGATRFADDVNALTNGRLSIKVFGGGELIPPLQTFDAVSQGTVEMGHGAAYYWAGKVPAAQFFTSVPFGMNAQGMNSWLYAGGGLELWREIYKPYNLVPFPLGNTGIQMGGWFNKKIESVGDLKGLKMRFPGLGGKVFAKAGGTPVLLPGGEIYTALDRGTIDATEWIGPYHDERLGLHRAAKYYYYPGWHEPGPVLELIINNDAWEKLPDDLKKAVEIAAAAGNVWMLSQFEAKNLEALHRLKEEHKVQVYPFPDDVIRELKRLTQEVLTEEADKDPQFNKVLAAYRKFMANNDGWSELSEAAYQEARNK